MEGSRTPLSKWFQAIRYLSAGISATQLHRLIGVTYKTAWLINHKLRRAIQEADRKWQLSGQVHIKGIFYAERRFHPSIYFHPREQPLLAGATVNRQGLPVQVKIKKVLKTETHYRSIHRRDGEQFLKNHVESAVRSQAHCTLHRFGNAEYVPLVALCKHAFRWMSDTFCGIGSKHLQAYLDEFSYRYNLSADVDSFVEHVTILAANTRKRPYSWIIRCHLFEEEDLISNAA